MALLTSARRVWDPRRGDADDDRTSPHGRGWRSLILSTALEFNYLTASLSFLTLVILPALLIGLLPPLAATWSLRGIEATVLAERHPVIAVVLLVLLLAVLVSVGRRVIPIVVDTFWHLHHTLVFPLFVGLREIICAGLERLPGQTTTAEQLDRRRRIGTGLAAALFVSGGVLLAWSVEFSTGSRLLANMPVREVGRAALRNAVAVMALSTAIASLYWLWREVASRRPVRNWAPGPVAGDATMVRVAHLSDLHLVGEPYGYRMESGTHGPQGNQRVRRAFQQLSAMHAATPIDRIFVTGDITDAGTRAEWVVFMDLVRQCPELEARLFFVPGNHDVNIIDRTNPGRLDMPQSTGQALRKLRVVLALDAIQGRALHVVDHASGALGPSLADYLRDATRWPLLTRLAERGTWRGRLEMARVWDAVFPLVTPPADAHGYGVILLDSNARRHFSVTNALGVIGRSQLRALAAILRSTRGRPWVVLLHHHLVEYPIPGIGLQERVSLSLINAPDVLGAMASHGAPVLVLHGHRHRDWIGTRGEAVLCSAPSVAFGSCNHDTGDGGFHLYDLALGADGGIQLACSTAVKVA